MPRLAKVHGLAVGAEARAALSLVVRCEVRVGEGLADGVVVVRSGACRSEEDAGRREAYEGSDAHVAAQVAL